MHLGPLRSSGFKAHADFDPFDGLDRHHGLGKFSVQLAIPLSMSPQPKGQTIDSHFDDTAKRISFVGHPINVLLRLSVSRRID